MTRCHLRSLGKQTPVGAQLPRPSEVLCLLPHPLEGRHHDA